MSNNSALIRLFAYSRAAYEGTDDKYAMVGIIKHDRKALKPSYLVSIVLTSVALNFRYLRPPKNQSTIKLFPVISTDSIYENLF